MNERVLRLLHLDGNSCRAPSARVEEAEESIRRRLYGGPRMVEVLAREHSPAPGERGGLARRRLAQERPVGSNKTAGP